jgi:hypothetical protein
MGRYRNEFAEIKLKKSESAHKSQIPEVNLATLSFALRLRLGSCDSPALTMSSGFISGNVSPWIIAQGIGHRLTSESLHRFTKPGRLARG